MPILNSNNNGFTLTEVMIAIVIMMIGAVGLLQSLNVAQDYNLKNHLRDEAVYVGEKYLNEMRGKTFDTVAPVHPATSVTFPLISTAGKIRGTGKKLMVNTSSDVLSHDALNNPTTLQLHVTVTWTYKGATYTNRVSAPISRMP
ncbi:type IV pilus modification PilV family protein [Geotalea toluenoxydans]|uniref:type IV pilus modification PilV family protein n=1 Tax=Geotalea toluenoxydans TaxID=421624 RepID=UPI000AD92353|nr:prepilin-type N-terminal cleavage/methylation domain-containing protein [Geotalea toluenoxydans]